MACSSGIRSGPWFGLHSEPAIRSGDDSEGIRERERPVIDDHDDLRATLRDAVGPAGWLDPADAAGMTIDFRGIFSGQPVAIVRPGTVDEVRAVVRACAAAGVAIVTQGGHTSLSGGSVPTDDRPSVLLSTTRMTRILSVDPVSYTHLTLPTILLV